MSKKIIREILKRNNISYSVRDYYKLAEKDPSHEWNTHGILYFVNIPTSEFNLKLKFKKESNKISIEYEDDGGNHYFSRYCTLDNFEENIMISMYLIEDHLKIVKEMRNFSSGNVPIHVSRGLKLKLINDDNTI